MKHFWMSAVVVALVTQNAAAAQPENAREKCSQQLRNRAGQKIAGHAKASARAPYVKGFGQAMWFVVRSNDPQLGSFSYSVLIPGQSIAFEFIASKGDVRLSGQFLFGQWPDEKCEIEYTVDGRSPFSNETKDRAAHVGPAFAGGAFVTITVNRYLLCTPLDIRYECLVTGGLGAALGLGAVVANMITADPDRPYKAYAPTPCRLDDIGGMVVNSAPEVATFQTHVGIGHCWMSAAYEEASMANSAHRAGDIGWRDRHIQRARELLFYAGNRMAAGGAALHDLISAIQEGRTAVLLSVRGITIPNAADYAELASERLTNMPSPAITEWSVGWSSANPLAALRGLGIGEEDMSLPRAFMKSGRVPATISFPEDLRSAAQAYIDIGQSMMANQQ